MNNNVDQFSFPVSLRTRRTFLKLLLCTQLVLLPTLSFALEESAEDLMIAVDNRDTGDSRRQKGELTLIDERRNERIRSVNQLAKRYKDHEKVLTQVSAPSEVKGTTILSYDWDIGGSDDETWLYLPKLRKVKRLAANDQSSYWLGSDFSYGDLTGLDVEDFVYEFVKEEQQEDGTWLIEAKPNPTRRLEVMEETGYEKIHYWVDREKSLVLKAKYWLREGNLLKYFTATDISEKSGVLVVGKSQMVLTRGGKLLHASIFRLTDVVFNIAVSDEALSTYAMEREL